MRLIKSWTCNAPPLKQLFFCLTSPIPLRFQALQSTSKLPVRYTIHDSINCHRIKLLLAIHLFSEWLSCCTQNITRYKRTLNHTESNTLRLVLEHQTPMFTGEWEAVKLISDECCLTCLQKSVLNYCERSWKPISNTTDKDLHWVLRESLGFMRPGCMRKANRSPAWLRILTEPKTKGGKRMFEMSPHTLRLHISYQSSLAYPFVHERRRDTSKSFFESVERLDSLSRFFFGGRIETRPRWIWTAITMHLWSIISQSQREVLFTWWALEWWNGKEQFCCHGNLNSYFWNCFGMFSK